jgi:alkylhydroperoxidase/carboxymuconolactone decarboxylase family protein YurZ
MRHAMLRRPLRGDSFLHTLFMEDAMGAMKEFAGLYYREGALDPKTMQLVALAAMAAAGCTS